MHNDSPYSSESVSLSLFPRRHFPARIVVNIKEKYFIVVFGEQINSRTYLASSQNIDKARKNYEDDDDS